MQPLLTNAQLYLLKDQIAALRSINLQLRAAREAQRAGLPTGAELSAPPAHSAAEALPQPPPGSAQPPADSELAVSQAGAAKKQSGGKLRVAAAKTAAKSAVKGRPAP